MSGAGRPSILQVDLLKLPGLFHLRQAVFLHRMRGDRGNGARALLYMDLATAVRLRMPFDQALEQMSEGYAGVPMLTFASEDRLLKLLAHFLSDGIERGLSLSESMRKLRTAFSRQEIGIVEGAEKGDRLGEALQRLADYRQTDARLKRLTSYLIYPVQLAGLASIIVSFILWKILPTYGGIFQTLGAEFPLLTQILIHVTAMVGPMLGVLVCLLAVGWVLYVLVGGYASWLTGIPLGLYLPVVGAVYRRARESRWLAALTLGLESGMAAEEAIARAGEISGGALQRRSVKAASLVMGGTGIGEACVRYGVLSAPANHRMEMVDWNGNFVEGVRALVEDMDRELTRRLEMLGRRVEILSNIAIGLIVAMIVIAIYLPMFGIPKLLLMAS